MPKLETISALGRERLDQRVEQLGGVAAGSGCATARRRGCPARLALSSRRSAARSSPRPVDRHRMLVGDRQRMVGQRHVEPRQRAPAAADHVEGPARGGACRSRRRRPPCAIFLAKRASPLRRRARRGGARRAAARRAAPTLPPATSTSSRLPPPRSPTMPSASGMAEMHALPGQLALLLAGQDARIEAERADPGEEGRAVRGLAHRGGGDDAGAADAHLVDQQPEALERGQRALLRVLARARRSRRRSRPRPAITFSLKMIEGMRVAPE